ncbi:MAG: hypothetical protein HWE08_05940 [Alphaproteobacteria bacterium]|nr:hypothetical protein [Alphaproteobacteria bacterium]
MIKRLFLAAALLAGGPAIHATENTFEFSGLTASDYQTGTSQYLVYMRDTSSGKIMQMELWNRTTKLIEQEGETLVEITQDWHVADGSGREIRSLNRVEDFSPVAQTATHQPDGTVTAFTFDGAMAKGDKSVEGNSAADFEIAMEQETLNWELDIETFALLPLEANKTFKLNFYHPGSKTPPTVYNYTVAGEETLTDMSGNALPCWLLEINYGGQGGATFWLRKDTGEMLRMEETYGKIKRYKVRLGVAVEQ